MSFGRGGFGAVKFGGEAGPVPAPPTPVVPIPWPGVWIKRISQDMPVPIMTVPVGPALVLRLIKRISYVMGVPIPATFPSVTPSFRYVKRISQSVPAPALDARGLPL